MPVDFRVIPPSVAASMNTQFIQEQEKFCQEAEFATNLIRAWGIVGEDDGESSAGHQKQKLMSPENLVARAVETTNRAFSAFREQGWIIRLASFDELVGDDRKTGF